MNLPLNVVVHLYTHRDVILITTKSSIYSKKRTYIKQLRNHKATNG